MSARDVFENLRTARENLSHGTTYTDVGEDAYEALTSILDDAIASFGAVIVLFENHKPARRSDTDA